MSKQSILDKITIVIRELQLAGDSREVDWLTGVKSDLDLLKEKIIPHNLECSLTELSQKLVAPRGYVDTQGDLDMATWANLLDDLDKDLKKTYNLK